MELDRLTHFEFAVVDEVRRACDHEAFCDDRPSCRRQRDLCRAGWSRAVVAAGDCEPDREKKGERDSYVQMSSRAARPVHSQSRLPPRPWSYIHPRLVCAWALPCSAALRYQATASASSCGTPRPLAYIPPEIVLRDGAPLLRSFAVPSDRFAIIPRHAASVQAQDARAVGVHGAWGAMEPKVR